jgi:hypothetical protein
MGNCEFCLAFQTLARLELRDLGKKSRDDRGARIASENIKSTFLSEHDDISSADLALWSKS